MSTTKKGFYVYVDGELRKVSMKRVGILVVLFLCTTNIVLGIASSAVRAHNDPNWWNQSVKEEISISLDWHDHIPFAWLLKD